ncbi:hypothetical protein [Sulfitobacter faviae]|uniref:hypothetical protein n=1 Tax=Sulfitobacter faviae TaxID=1775881 RepID=UPI0031BBC765
MTDLSRSRLWVMRLSFVALALVILFFHLLPLETTPRAWAGPDLLLGFACAWGFDGPNTCPRFFWRWSFCWRTCCCNARPAFGRCWP